MKKILVTIALLGFGFAAQAVEVGINGGRETANTDRTTYGLTVGEKFGTMGVTAGFDAIRTGTHLDRWFVVGSYDVAKVGPVTLAAKAGAAYVDQKDATDGYAFLVGAGAEYPLTKSLALTADYRYQAGQSRINNLNGSTVTAGLKLAF